MFQQKIFTVTKIPPSNHLNKDNYIKKANDIIEDEIKQIKYIKPTNETCNELKRFPEFLYRHFYKHDHYEEMRQDLISPVDFLQPLRRINLNLSVILL